MTNESWAVSTSKRPPPSRQRPRVAPVPSCAIRAIAPESRRQPPVLSRYGCYIFAGNADLYRPSTYRWPDSLVIESSIVAVAQQPGVLSLRHVRLFDR